jgi:hypothetical protein
MSQAASLDEDTVTESLDMAIHVKTMGSRMAFAIAAVLVWCCIERSGVLDAPISKP